MKKNNYLEGIYRRKAKGFGFVKVENMEDEIYIYQKTNQKMH